MGKLQRGTMYVTLAIVGAFLALIAASGFIIKDLRTDLAKANGQITTLKAEKDADRADYSSKLTQKEAVITSLKRDLSDSVRVNIENAAQYAEYRKNAEAQQRILRAALDRERWNSASLDALLKEARNAPLTFACSTSPAVSGVLDRLRLQPAEGARHFGAPHAGAVRRDEGPDYSLADSGAPAYVRWTRTCTPEGGQRYRTGGVHRSDLLGASRLRL